MAKLYFLPRSALKDRSRLLRLGWWIEGMLVGAFLRLLRVLPPAQATGLSRALFRTVGPRTGVQTKLLRNLAILHPQAPMAELRSRARMSFGWLGTAVAEIAQLEQTRREMARRCEFVADPAAEATLADPEAAAVLVTAHVGPWTHTNLVAGHYGFPLTIVYAPESNPLIRDQILALRKALPVQLIERDNSMRALLKELGAGHKIGLASDVRLDGGEPIELFGHAMETNTVPARLALRQGCPLIPMRAERLPGERFRITAEAPIEPTDPDAPMDERIRQVAEGLSRVYERWIREDTSQWMAMARRWPKALELDAIARAKTRETRCDEDRSEGPRAA